MSARETRAERQRERYIRFRERALADPEVRASYEEGLDPSTFPLRRGRKLWRRRSESKKGRERLSIYISREKLAVRPVERLMKMSKERDRSVNHLVVKAILEFLEREDKKK